MPLCIKAIISSLSISLTSANTSEVKKSKQIVSNYGFHKSGTQYVSPLANEKVITPGFVKTPLTDKNNFPMYFIIGTDSAANIIIKGMYSKRFEITFSISMYLIMKMSQTLTNFISNYTCSVIKKTTE